MDKTDKKEQWERKVRWYYVLICFIFGHKRNQIANLVFCDRCLKKLK